MDSFSLIIFGITSNLAQIKLIPALYDIAEKNLLPENATIVGIARSSKTDEEFAQYIREVLNSDNIHHTHDTKPEVAEKLIKMFRYVDGDVGDPALYNKLDNVLKDLKSRNLSCDNRIFYLATYPNLYQSIFKNLKNSGLAKGDCGWVRLMVEKPIGNDLDSAKELNRLLQEYFRDDQIYRLDHYLGKETLQNILTFRFGNDMYEPLINKDYVDHIQITASEDVGIGKRGGYYDSVGALKDVGQNHQLQMLAFATMEAPEEFTNKAITRRRLQLLQQLVPHPESVVFGQYQGYINEENVDAHSETDTFYALKTEIDNDRFRGVPIYIRAGKKLKQMATEISIVFKTPENRLFKHMEGGNQPNVLIYRLQPNEGIVLRILTKKPGFENQLESSYMQYCYHIDPDGHFFPDAYERLLVDAIRGDQTFFNDAAEIEAQWAFIDPLFRERNRVPPYEVGSWGPEAAHELIRKDGREWLEPSMDFCRI